MGIMCRGVNGVHVMYICLEALYFKLLLRIISKVHIVYRISRAQSLNCGSSVLHIIKSNKACRWKIAVSNSALTCHKLLKLDAKLKQNM